MRVRDRAAAFRLLERAFADQAFLRFEVALEKDGALQRLLQILRQVLPAADGAEFGQVVFVAGGIGLPDLRFSPVQAVKVFAQITAALFLHGFAQLEDAVFDLARFFVRGGFLSVAQKTPALREMVQGAAQGVTILLQAQVEFFGQAPEPVVVGVFVPVVVRALPEDKVLVEGIAFFLSPRLQTFPAQRRAQLVFRQYFEQFYLAQPAPEVMPAQRACVRPVLYGGPFHVFLAGDAFLEDIDTFVQ